MTISSMLRKQKALRVSTRGRIQLMFNILENIYQPTTDRKTKYNTRNETHDNVKPTLCYSML